MRELSNEQVWRRARKVFIASQPKNHFGLNGWVDYDLVEDDPSYVDAERLLNHLGIDYMESLGTSCTCFCGGAAEFNPSTRRYHCPKAPMGCGLLWVTLTNLVERFVRDGRDSKPRTSSSRSSSRKHHIYVH